MIHQNIGHNTEQKVYTDVFDGLQVEIDPDVEAPNIVLIAQDGSMGMEL